MMDKELQATRRIVYLTPHVRQGIYEDPIEFIKNLVHDRIAGVYPPSQFTGESGWVQQDKLTTLFPSAPSLAPATFQRRGASVCTLYIANCANEAFAS